MYIISDTISRRKIEYIQQKDEFDYLKSLIDSLEKGNCVGILLQGPPGTGKTLLAISLAKAYKASYYIIDGSPDLDRRDIEGNWELLKEETKFNYGPLTLAIKDANNEGIAFIIINEINAIRENEQISLNSLLSENHINLISKGFEKHELNSESKLIIIGTINLGVIGINKLQEAFEDRFIITPEISYPLKNKEIDIATRVMKGVKIRAAKIAMVMLYEALEDLANIRIVLFTGGYDALNILVKDFNEPLKLRNFDKFGLHATSRQNLDGLSIKHESKKLEKKDIIIVVSDGQPAADGGYSLVDAIPDIHDVRKGLKIFAFSIDSQGDYLNKMYGKDWILTSTRNELELGNKMVKFCQIIVKEFYR